MPTDDPYGRVPPARGPKPPCRASPGPRRRRAQGAKQRRERAAEVLIELAALWFPHPQGGGATYSAVVEPLFAHLGWARLEAIANAVHPLPWSILRPLAAFPAWVHEADRVSSPPTNAPEHAVRRIQQLPDEVRRWRCLHSQINEAMATLIPITERAWAEAAPGETPDGFGAGGYLDELQASLGCAMRIAQDRMNALEHWIVGTRPARLTGSGKSEGKAQNLARLRAVTIKLAQAINRALPTSRRDRRVVHGALRVPVLRRTIAIVHTIYGVLFAEAELRDAILKSARNRPEPPK